MQITKFRVSNYKSYSEQANSIEFTSGINIVTGQNNAGKTALLEALSFQFNPNPHRTTKTIPTRGAAYNEIAQVDVSFRVSKQELEEALLTFKGTGVELYIPRPMLGTKFAEAIGYRDHASTDRLVEWLLKREHDFELILHTGPVKAGRGPPRECRHSGDMKQNAGTRHILFTAAKLRQSVS